MISVLHSRSEKVTSGSDVCRTIPFSFKVIISIARLEELRVMPCTRSIHRLIRRYHSSEFGFTNKKLNLRNTSLSSIYLWIGDQLWMPFIAFFKQLGGARFAWLDYIGVLYLQGKYKFFISFRRYSLFQFFIVTDNESVKYSWSSNS